MWELSSKQYTQGFSSTKGVNAQGFHRKRVTYWRTKPSASRLRFGMPSKAFDQPGDVRLVMLCNPVPSGPVFDAFGKLRGITQSRHHPHINFDTPNLVGLTMESLLQLSEEELDYASFPWLIRRRSVKEMYPSGVRFRFRLDTAPIPVIPIQIPILNCLGQMFRGHPLHTTQVCDGARHLLDPIVRPRRSPIRRTAISRVRSPASSSAHKFRSALGGMCAL